MLENPQLEAGLEIILRSERDALVDLQSTLDKERKAVLDQDSDALSEIAQKKRTLVNVLGESSEHRSLLLQQYGVEHDKKGMVALLELCNPSDELTALADQVNSLSEQCKIENLNNGLRIRKTEQYVRRAIQILRGEGSRHPELYDSGGETTTGNAFRILGKA